jgi:circadian clock protein KaiB
MQGRSNSSSTEKPEAESTPVSATEAFEQALAQQPAHYVLVLYVAGTAPRSLRAVALARKLCQEHLADCHDLQVVDIYQQPGLAEEAGILAVPALVKKEPPPQMTFVGDLSDSQRLLQGLGLPRRPPGGAP